MPGKNDDADIAEFISITRASAADARKFLKKHKRMDLAIDAFYNDPLSASSSSTPNSNSRAPSMSAIARLFDKYKDKDDSANEEISIDGTFQFCEDLKVDPEDVVLLAIAYELKSPRMGTWTKAGWNEGWRNLRCDNIDSMRQILPRLRDQLASNNEYFTKVYNHTFDFARNEGQRSLAVDTAKGLWAILLPHGLKGGALSRSPLPDANGDIKMDNVDPTSAQSWTDERTAKWFQYLDEKRLKGISKDIWHMFLEFVRTVDSRYTNYDPEGAWPSTIDDFVERDKERLGLTSGSR